MILIKGYSEGNFTEEDFIMILMDFEKALRKSLSLTFYYRFFKNVKMQCPGLLEKYKLLVDDETMEIIKEWK